MAVSRRLRFEILKRDDYTCRYCGAKAPDVPLTVDHVIPTALGGADDPENLVTACQPCNSGKTSILPESPLVADVKRDALRWGRCLEIATLYRRQDRERVERLVEQFDEAWSRWHVAAMPIPRPHDWRDSIERFFALGLTMDDLGRLVITTMGDRRLSAVDRWRFFCGCCWRSIAELQKAAHKIQEDYGQEVNELYNELFTEAASNGAY